MPNVKFYLAARYARHQEMLGYAETLGNTFDWTSTARWIKGEHEMQIPTESATYSELAEFNQRCLFDDLEDIERAGLFITFTEVPNEYDIQPTGGRHVELGYALAHNKLIWVIGPRENVFYWHPSIQVFDSFDEVLKTFSEENVAC